MIAVKLFLESEKIIAAIRNHLRVIHIKIIKILIRS